MNGYVPRAFDGVHVLEFEGDLNEMDMSTPTGPDLGIFIDAFVAYPHVSVLPAMTSTRADDGVVQLLLAMVPRTDEDGIDDYYGFPCSFDLRLRYLAP